MPLVVDSRKPVVQVEQSAVNSNPFPDAIVPVRRVGFLVLDPEDPYFYAADSVTAVDNTAVIPIQSIGFGDLPVHGMQTRDGLLIEPEFYAADSVEEGSASGEIEIEAVGYYKTYDGFDTIGVTTAPVLQHNLGYVDNITASMQKTGISELENYAEAVQEEAWYIASDLEGINFSNWSFLENDMEIETFKVRGYIDNTMPVPSTFNLSFVSNVITPTDATRSYLENTIPAADGSRSFMAVTVAPVARGNQKFLYSTAVVVEEKTAYLGNAANVYEGATVFLDQLVNAVDQKRLFLSNYAPVYDYKRGTFLRSTVVVAEQALVTLENIAPVSAGPFYGKFLKNDMIVVSSSSTFLQPGITTFGREFDSDILSDPLFHEYVVGFPI